MSNGFPANPVPTRVLISTGKAGMELRRSSRSYGAQGFVRADTFQSLTV